MTCRLLGRCARLLSRGSPQAAAAAARLPVPVAGSAEPLWAQTWPRASGRLLCEGRSFNQESDFPLAPKRTQLDELAEKAAAPEEILVAWAELGGNANQAASALVKLTRLVQGEKDRSKTYQSALLMDDRLKAMMDTIIGQVGKPGAQM